MADDLELEIEDDLDQPKPLDVELDAEEAPPKEEAPAEEPKLAAEPEIDPGTASLKAQLEAARREKAEALKLVEEHASEARKAKVEVVDSQHQLILNTIDAVKKDADSTERELAAAFSEGDYEKAAKLQRKIAKAEGDLQQLENARLTVEQRQKEPRVEGRVAPLPPSDPVEAFASQLSPKSSSWIKEHPECVTDPVLNAEMIAAHGRAARQGIAADSPEYFAFIEKRLGFGEPAADTPQPAKRTAVPAAPVSRDAPSISARSTGKTVIRLTPEQQEIAEYMGMTPREYALELAQIEKEKRAG